MNPRKAVLLLAVAAGVAVWLWSHVDGRRHAVSGTFETDEIRVASRFGGRVVETPVEEGDLLTNGQVVARLAAPELDARREEAAALLAELEAGPRPQDISAAQLEWEALSAERDYAAAEAVRQTELSRDQVVADADKDRAESRARALERQAAAARQRYEVLAAGTRPERVQQARAQLAALEAQRAELVVTAPDDASLETLAARPGDVLAPNAPVATLLSRRPPWIKVYVPATWLGSIAVGDTVRIRTDAFPGRDFDGTVEQIARQAAFTPRNVQTVGERVKQVYAVKVRAAEADALKPGMAADVFFADVPAPPR